MGTKILIQYKVSTPDIDFLKDFFEGWNAGEMYKNADAIAAKNAKLTSEQKKKLQTIKQILIASLGVTKPFEVFGSLRHGLILSGIPQQNLQILASSGRFVGLHNYLVSALFPVLEYSLREKLEAKEEE